MSISRHCKKNYAVILDDIFHLFLFNVIEATLSLDVERGNSYSSIRDSHGWLFWRGSSPGSGGALVFLFLGASFSFTVGSGPILS